VALALARPDASFVEHNDLCMALDSHGEQYNDRYSSLRISQCNLTQLL
jgi:hypothetical protein